MLLNILQSTGQPPKQNYPAPVSTVRRLEGLPENINDAQIHIIPPRPRSLRRVPDKLPPRVP